MILRQAQDHGERSRIMILRQAQDHGERRASTELSRTSRTMKKIKVGILGATGMVGQRFVVLLSNHPWFDVKILAASPQSANKTYKKAVLGRWKMEKPIPQNLKNIIVKRVEEDMLEIAREVDLVFSALDLEREKIKDVEEKYASLGVAVVSNNSVHRWTADIPMIIPEVNSEHLELIKIQRKNRGWKKGCIVVKPNCSIQSYVPILTALKRWKPLKVSVVSNQAISGAGKTFNTWPEMIDNIIPFINGEDEKSEKEPLRIWGKIKNRKIEIARFPKISATCIRVPLTNGHMAAVSVLFQKNPTKKELISAVKNFKDPLKSLKLPSSPKQFITYFEEEDRPQSILDRNLDRGMGIGVGRLRKDDLFHWKFVGLSHNTIRGAAGGAILTAELLVKKGYL